MIDGILSTAFLSRLRAFIRNRVGSEADADDLLQDVLAKLVERGGGVREESLPAWLFTVARRAVLDRRRTRSVAVSEDEDSFPGTELQGPDAAGEIALCMEPLLEALDVEDRELLRRVDMQGQRQTEIARELGISVSTVKSRTQRARAKLLAALTDCCSIATDSRGSPYDFELRKGKPCSPCGPSEGGCD